MANVFGGGGTSSSCGDSGISRVLPTSSEALQGSSTQTFTSSPNVFSKGKGGTDGVNLRDFYTKSEIQKLLRLKADISSVYTEEEVDQLLANLQASINVDIADFITEPEVDEKISDSYDSLVAYLTLNYYTRSALYTKTEIDNLLEGLGGLSPADFVLKAPQITSDNTIAPGGNAAVPLTLVASTNPDITTIQHWIDNESNSVGRVRTSGRVEFYGYMSLGENIETWRPALDVNERRISGVADPIHLLDAVNRHYMEEYVTDVVDSIIRGSDTLYDIDCLEY
jgi:hypothetical protein